MTNLLLPLLLIACGPAGLGGQSGSEMESLECAWTPVGIVSAESEGEPTHAAGFQYSFESLAAPYPGQWSGPLTFQETEELLTLTLELGSSPRAYSSEDIGCISYYEVNATVTAVSDSALDEVIETTLKLQDNAWALLSADIDEADIGGDIERQGDTLSIVAGGQTTLFGDLYWSIGEVQYDAVASFELMHD